MTSLFRRSSGGGGAGARGAGAGSGGGAAGPQELNNSRPARQVRRLEFNQAMDDFKTMFPNMDYDIIECVLRANSGAVDATIDQLLQMNLEGGGGSAEEDSSDSEDSIPPEILERTLEPDSSDEEPPPVYSPPAYHMHMFDRPYPPTPPPRTDVLGSGPSASQRHYRNWNPPLLGNLPDDFLRILPQQLDSIQGNSRCAKSVSREGGLPPTAGDQDSRWKQYLEDERIALFLQNEEFMKELQRNRDFLLALERDRLKYESQKSKSSNVAVGDDFGFPSSVPGNSDANPAVSEDALFRDKLKHMGKSTRRKLFELARAFSEKTKMRKSRRKHLPKHQSLGPAASTANLLDDVDGHACDEETETQRRGKNLSKARESDEDFRGRRQETPKMEEALREGQ
ncbi:CUE domain-containing protein 1 isoform X1 [Heterocephalus glaber]|uniref:CUE domain-containing protein 1 isoform X1 n=1 Tax=Heterocephalus glaber TaxID=10181 RepID=A0AAX6RFR2_HETGA|nr:CUE domain-containing protein 1 isoform X1 [Heterocephalus glaber]XP_021095686.1 CUE domain-containing protein 1 isoform X1 [Heterocephalus glaber]XP_021095687.1 CUE domain-containing protein 1 isoform X1 [Heterocephalus glaber]XP_021095688.1 CUE domain-containing protein 1 isoform X1 [Heterocephalus glaber]XP_021095689.1 CUE domain-containing protein 1 isoform X1 [Heterocephalus glaber]XP_021095690.1 CUE domain-containing protein 1 isoform X1 [Heterocephalus glaber]XP_021095691.1 CUE doma